MNVGAFFKDTPLPPLILLPWIYVKHGIWDPVLCSAEGDR